MVWRTTIGGWIERQNERRWSEVMTSIFDFGRIWWSHVNEDVWSMLWPQFVNRDNQNSNRLVKDELVISRVSGVWLLKNLWYCLHLLFHLWYYIARDPDDVIVVINHFPTTKLETFSRNNFQHLFLVFKRGITSRTSRCFNVDNLCHVSYNRGVLKIIYPCLVTNTKYKSNKQFLTVLKL